MTAPFTTHVSPAAGPATVSPATPGPAGTVQAGEGPASGLPTPPDDGARPGRLSRPARFGVLGMLVAAAAFWLINLSANGWSNSFYTAAIQAGSQSWSAFLWGSSDAAGSITVDKPPASLWLPELAVRVFGLSSWSVLVPEVLLGVASVWLVFAAVRRSFGTGAGFLAGAALVLTPVATLMFRFDNPDALLVALMAAATYCVLRAVEDGRTRWMLLAGAAIGLGFLTKQMQAFLVLPGLGLAYLWAAPVSVGRRVRDALLAVGALVVTAGWWVLLTVIVPAGSRPYIGGSQNNSFLELTFGYNGFGRLTGDETGSVGGGGAGIGGGMWGATGIGRLFGSEFGGQIAWLAPAAAILLVTGLVLTARAPRTDLRRASYVAWGGWLVVTWAVFSEMSGIFHAYYTVALAPALAALVGAGSAQLWRRRDSWWAVGLLAATTLATAVWAYVLLDRSSTFLPWLRVAVLLGGFVAAVALLAGRLIGSRDAAGSAVLRGAATLAVVVGLAAPAAYSVQTLTQPHTGSLPTAGPTVQSAGFGPGGMGGGPGGGRGGQGGPPGGFGGQQGQQGQGQQGTQGQQPPGQGGQQGGSSQGQGQTQQGGQAQGQLPGGDGFGGGMGGLLDGTSVSSELTTILQTDADTYDWAAATTGSQNAASYQLASGASVMPIGGFNGSDPSPTLEQFKQDVAEGRIHYYIGSGSGGFGGSMGGSDAASEIASWVEDTFQSQTVDGVTIYDLSSGATSSAS
ncbi:ArnT family glycosyltransferase [Luteimicrobium sp. NPDC057192]|uniref:ArnT family glycosyltransferase n=1 Tax=Luteimicrobium sp. NPDC057192 TaxID=3346042 RepID=UPI003634CB79